MSASTLPARRRRRHRRRRRGTLDRPVNGHLYRASFLLVVFPLLLAAFSVRQPAPLQKPTLPPAFDARATIALARGFATEFPDRRPGTSSAIAAGQWFRNQIAAYGLPVSTDAWSEDVPGAGRVTLRNLYAVAPGQSPDVIVVMAHRDDLGIGPGADDNASGTAALIELARSYAQPETESQGTVVSPHTLIFLSTDGGAYGGLGAVRFAQRSPYQGHIVAVMNLDALAGTGPARLLIGGDAPRSPTASLIATTRARILDQTGSAPLMPGFSAQLADLAFPFSLYEQGPFVGAAIPAITITTSGERPRAGFGDTVAGLQRTRLASLGQAAQEILGSLNQGLELSPSAASFVWVDGRTISGWAVELVLIALLMPFLIAIVDLYALSRRHHIPVMPAVLSLRARLGFWLSVAALFACFLLLGLWPTGPPRPVNLETAVAGTWPALTLTAFGLLVAVSWAATRPRLASRTPPTPEDQLAGAIVALVGLAICGLLTIATNPFALIYVLPALHLWLWLPQLRAVRAVVRVALFVAGLIAPLLLVTSLAARYHLGWDAPWYLLLLVIVGYIKPVPVLLVLAGAAAAGQLAALAAGRYAAPPHEPPPGTVRRAIRIGLLLALRARASEWPVSARRNPRR
ncbi:MAG: M28 family peptidase [Actinomycetes bacterium]